LFTNLLVHDFGEESLSSEAFEFLRFYPRLSGLAFQSLQ
jgi:hypothetical protein